MEMWAVQNADGILLAFGAIVIIGFMVGYPVVMGARHLINKWKNR